MSSGAVLEVRKISKSFPGVRALDTVSFDVSAGEIHALVGENGAGKSTLLKVLSGAIEPDAGEIYLNGRLLPPARPAARLRAGIAMVYQELPLVPDLTVAENIMLARLPAFAGGLLLNHTTVRRRAVECLQQLGVAPDPDAKVSTLGPGERQFVEIAKAIALDARVILLDEPSASLSARDFEHLKSVVRRLAAGGAGIVYISHRLDEIFELATRVTVLRDGRTVSTDPIGKLDRNTLIARMVGREITAEYPAIDWEPREEALRVEGLSTVRGNVNIKFSLRRGEILGVAGLVGAGRTELAMALMGSPPSRTGNIYVGGRKTRIHSPADALDAGIGLLSEDRKTLGILAERPIRENITLAALHAVSRGGILNRSKERGEASVQMRELDVRAASMETPIGDLSGGNQQKVLLGRLLHRGTPILLVDEPTRGVDVGARAEIYERLKLLAKEHGVAIFMISSDLPEVLGMSHRILIMRGGAIVATLPRAGATPELVMQYAAGAG